MSSVRNADLIEKMTSADKDFRFMAINDIMESLKNKSITLDDTTENQLITNLLKLLDDPNAEVQNLDVKCLALLVNYLAQTRLFLTLEALGKKVFEAEEENSRDIAAIALRSSVIEFNSLKNVSFNSVVDRLMPQLVNILANGPDNSVIEQVLDIVTHMFRRTGNKLEFNYEGLNDALFKHAESERYGVRRRAQQALAMYAEVVDNDQFKTIVDRVYKCCKKYMSNSALLKTYVATTTAICKNSGHRFQQSLPPFAELFLQICNRSQEDDLREVTIGAFEMFFNRCPEAVTPFVDEISKIVIALLSHDPNYSYDDSDNEEDKMDIDESSVDGSDDDEDSDYSDDEDVSWKVRRASAKCVEAIITHRHDLQKNYDTFGKLLIKRMKEREDNVKQDIMNAYLALIRQTRLLIPDSIVPWSLRVDSSCMYEKISMETFNEFINEDESRKKIFDALHEQIPSLIRRISSAQKTKNTKVLEQTFVLLTSLVTTYPASIGSNLPQLSRGIKQSLNDRDGNMKLSTLRFLATFFATHDYSEYQNGVESIIGDVFKLAGDFFSKVSSEAVEAINSLICSMANSSASMNPKLLEQVYNLLISKFQVTDMDQEVKDKTTYGLGFFVSSFGDSLGTQLEKCLSLLADRLNNEISRQSALKALTIIARSDKNFSMASVIPSITSHFGEFLRKANRTLRINTLSLAIAIAERTKPGNFDGVDLSSTFVEIPILLCDTDLQIAQLALRLAALLVAQHPQQIGNVNPVLEAVILLTKSALVQGKTQKALLEFLDVYTRSDVGNKPEFREFVGQFMEYVASWKCYSRPAFLTVAKSIATLARGNKVATVLPLTKELEKFVLKGQTLEIKILSILTIGELGRLCPAVYAEKTSI
uniref:Cullin-associated NEDD8-dissociated protein 1 n=1 Tax=Panagrolaimus sp. ES5 TaxID=591445 RepID=A0AC34GQV5_9BILA